MNHFEAPTDELEVQRLMREEDSLGADSSLFLRATRQLTQVGKPIGQILVFTIPVTNGNSMPIGMLTFTENRLIFWPVLPRRKCLVLNKPKMPMPDHITVDFPSEKVHVTSYRSSGKAIHAREGWRSAPLEKPDFRMLFTFLVRLKIVEEQDVIVTRKFLTPKNDEHRRKAEFAECVRKFVVQHLPLQGDAEEKHYVSFGIFVAPEVMTAESLPPTLIPIPSVNQLVDDWPKNAEYSTIVAQLPVRDRYLGIVAGFPPGSLRDDLSFGFPQRVPENEKAKRKG